MGGEHAARINAAAELAEAGIPAAEAARVLAGINSVDVSKFNVR